MSGKVFRANRVLDKLNLDEPSSLGLIFGWTVRIVESSIFVIFAIEPSLFSIVVIEPSKFDTIMVELSMFDTVMI